MIQRPSLPKTKCSDSYYYSDAQFETMNKRRVSESVSTHDTHTHGTHSYRLPRVTFCLGDKPMRDLLWCEKM